MTVAVTVELNGVRVPLVLDDTAVALLVEAVTANTEPAHEPEWLTLRDAAHRIGRTEDATYKLVTRLGLKHQEVPGGRIQIRTSELDAALATRTGRTTR